ncbi:MAG: 1-acyl-sn-glycerol-3-phosphate acyltransferase [Clostridia bacterium]|nr:1-acyl-sn-glycerol-3-phosphate acyltransferase [Clostridia bacterium]
MNWFFEIGRWVGVITGLPVQWLFFKRKTYYESESAKTRQHKGAALVIANHYNPLDFIWSVLAFFPRKLYVVAAENAFCHPLLRFGMRFWGGIECNRATQSPRFIVEAARELKKGHLVMIFPEGHNTPDGQIHPFYPSYLAIALRGGAPLLPMVSDGNYGLFKRLHVLVGDPIDIKQYFDGDKATRADIERINGIIYDKVLELRAELDRRIQQDKKR